MVQFWVEDKELLDSTEGYVLAVLQPDNGDFEKLQTFRTDQSPDECQRLIETLESIDTGRIVIAAGRGKALQYFKPETWAAFKSIGGTGKPALAGAQAIIGIQGTLPGQAMENETKPFIELSIPFAVPVEYQYDVARRYDENSQLIEEKVDTTLDSAKVIRYYPNRIGLKTYSPIAGFLLLSEIYDRGWRVKIDDIPGKIYPADGIFRAVYLNPGRHTLEFDYWPDGLTAGILITLLTGILLVLAVGIRINILLRQRAQEKLEEELIHKAK
jgi:hypothetical protein